MHGVAVGSPQAKKRRLFVSAYSDSAKKAAEQGDS